MLDHTRRQITTAYFRTPDGAILSRTDALARYGDQQVNRVDLGMSSSLAAATPDAIDMMGRMA